MFRHATRRPPPARAARGLWYAAAVAALSLLASACLAQGGPAPYARGRILVKFRDPAGAHPSALASVEARSAAPIGGLPVQVLTLAPGVRETDAVAAMRRRPDVEFAELDMRLPLAFIPNDPGYANQWHLPRIGAPAAWDLTVGSPDIIVAVLDTGCDPTHPDLSPNYVAGWNFYNNNTDTRDVYGHGTAVAGCVGATSNNGAGVAGLCWVGRIMPCRVTDAAGYGYYSTISRALRWAADHGARIANISFEGVAGSASIRSAAQYMWSKGGLTVCAAGNQGIDPGYQPGPHLISVSATDSANRRTSWSCYGPWVSVAAPGANICTTARGGGYGYFSGTSFSAPIACGVLALAWSINPQMSNTEVREALTMTATDLGAAGPDSDYGHGLVNAGAATARALSLIVDRVPPTVSIASPWNGAVVAASVPVEVAVSDDVGVARVDLYVDGVMADTAAKAPYTLAWGASGAAVGPHTLVARAYDASGNSAESAPVIVNLLPPRDTEAPTCAIVDPADGSRITPILVVGVEASDDRGLLAVRLYVDGKTAGMARIGSCRFIVSTRTWAPGAHVILAEALDRAGNRGTAAVTLVK